MECGCKLPVIADACQFRKEGMPVSIGTMDNQKVSDICIERQKEMRARQHDSMQRPVV